MFSQYALDHAWLIPLLPAAACMIIGVFLRRLPVLAATAAIGMSLLSFILAAGVAAGMFAQGITIEQPLVYKIPWLTLPGLAVDMGVYLDPLSVMMLVVVTLVALVVQLYSVGYMHGDEGFGRFFSYISLFAAAMLGLVIAVNFLQLFVFWELVGLCSYLLIGYYFHKISAREAAKKAFMTTRVGDFGLLIGILLLQFLFGTLDFQALPVQIPAYLVQHGSGLLTVVALLLFVGPIGKSGQFPLHVWLPDAMEGPTPVSALIHAATMVVAGVYLVARAFFLFSALPEAMAVIAWVGAFTACFAASIALTQRDIKRILAYSTISQLGYMMLALGVGSLTASMFHLLTHAFFKALLFLAAGAVLHGLPGKNDIFEMGGLRRKMPATFAAMVIGVLAISGIPPFAGFFSKDEILLAVFAVSKPLYAVAMVTAFMTTFYMARLLFVVFCGPEKSGQQAHEAPLSMKIPMAILGLLAIVGGYIPYTAGFGDWVRFGPAAHLAFDWEIAGSSTLLALAAIGLAWLIYGSGCNTAAVLARRSGLAYQLSYHKYYLDEAYLWLNHTLVDGFGKLLSWLELHVVEGILKGLAGLVGQLGNGLRKAQSGNLRVYGLVMFGAAMLMLLWLLFDPLLKGLLAGGGY